MICRRGDPEQAPPKTSSDWPIVAMLGLVAILFAGSGAYWITKRITGATDKPPAEPPAEPAPPPAEPGQPVPRPDPFKAERARFDNPPEQTPPPSAEADEITEKELESLRKRVKVTFFSKPNCTLCNQARLFMKSRGIPFRELDIEASPTDKVLLESSNPAGTVPTFDVDGKTLVGYDPNVLLESVDKAAIARKKR